MKLAMCGYRCDLCKAFSGNVSQRDERGELSKMWKKYYDIDSSAQDIHCDGCRCGAPGVRLDDGCPVRPCVLEKGLNHCGECGEFPCAVFTRRKGHSPEDAKAALGDAFDMEEYETYLRAYDNKTRLEALR